MDRTLLNLASWEREAFGLENQAASLFSDPEECPRDAHVIRTLNLIAKCQTTYAMLIQKQVLRVHSQVNQFIKKV